MKAVMAGAMLGILLVGACSPREETGRAVDAADTVVTIRQEMDTAIITTDTTVDVDTTRREGDRAVGRDTVQP
ncbi:MAG TPA: hypothetical protein VMN37_00850 [Gemmatimonadales bacterium]|nr:hypothetical protein [Gemmatimonadales bacterium]